MLLLPELHYTKVKSLTDSEGRVFLPHVPRNGCMSSEALKTAPEWVPRPYSPGPTCLSSLPSELFPIPQPSPAGLRPLASGPLPGIHLLYPLRTLTLVLLSLSNVTSSKKLSTFLLQVRVHDLPLSYPTPRGCPLHTFITVHQKCPFSISFPP